MTVPVTSSQVSCLSLVFANSAQRGLSLFATPSTHTNKHKRSSDTSLFPLLYRVRWKRLEDEEDTASLFYSRLQGKSTPRIILVRSRNQFELTRIKGGEDTFGVDYQFTKDLRDLVREALPKIKVESIVYPKYETRGDLGNCVSHFRDW